MNSGRGEFFRDYIGVPNKQEKSQSGSERKKNTDINYL